MAAVATKGASESGSLATRPVRRPSIRRTPGASNQSANMAAIPQRRSYWCRLTTSRTSTKAQAAWMETVVVPPEQGARAAHQQRPAQIGNASSRGPRRGRRPRRSARPWRRLACTVRSASTVRDGGRPTENALIDVQHGTSVRLVAEPAVARRACSPIRASAARSPSSSFAARPELRALRRQQAAGHPVLDQLRAAAHVAHQQRRPHRHALEHHVREGSSHDGSSDRSSSRRIPGTSGRWPRKWTLSLDARARDEPVELPQVALVVVAHASCRRRRSRRRSAGGRRARRAAARRGRGSRCPGPSTGVICATCPSRAASGAMPSSSRIARRRDAVGIEALAVEAVVDMGGHGRSRPSLNLPRSVLRDGEDRARRAAEDEAHPASRPRSGEACSWARTTSGGALRSGARTRPSARRAACWRGSRPRRSGAPPDRARGRRCPGEPC